MKTQASLACILLSLTSVCSWGQPANNTCANAILLPTAATCSNTSGTVASSTPDGSSACSGTPVMFDVWYRFVATTPNPTIALTVTGSSFHDARIEVLSGCALSTSLYCGPSPFYAAGLTPGNTYYIRVYSLTGPAPASNGGFNICIMNDANYLGGRTREVFRQSILSGPGVLNDPWEITYGPDDFFMDHGS